MKYHLHKRRPVGWMLGFFIGFVFGLVPIGGVWGMNPTMNLSPGGSYCLDNSVVNLNVVAPTGGAITAFHYLRIGGSTVLTAQVSTVGRRSFILATTIPCGNNLQLEVSFDYIESNLTVHSNYILSQTIDINCIPLIVYPAVMCNLPGASYFPMVNVSGFGIGQLTFVASNSPLITLSNGTIVVGQGQANNVTYDVNWTENGTCGYTGPTNIQLVPPLSSNVLSYGVAQMCLPDSSIIGPPSATPLGGTFTISPPCPTFNSNTGEITAIGTTPGTYQVTYTPPIASCASPVSQTIVLQNDAVLITMPTQSYCSNTGNTQVPTVNPLFMPAISGSFFSNAPNYSSTSGTINTTGASPGTYTLQYITSGPGNVCQNTYTFSGGITIVAPPDPSFLYNPDSMCRDQSVISPISVDTTGDRFFAQGVDINPSTGSIAPSTSTGVGGPILVTHIVGSTCRDTTTFPIYLFERERAGFYYGVDSNVTSGSYCLPEFPLSATKKAATATSGSFAKITGGPIGINSVTGELSLSPGSAGAYVLRYTTNGSCPAIFDNSVTIRPTPTVNFNYSPDHLCKTQGFVQGPVSVPGLSGVFQAAGLNINSVSGEITPFNSGVSGGPFVITFSTIAPECPSIGTAQVWLHEQDKAGFYFGSDSSSLITSTSFCSNEGFAMPSLRLGTEAGGTFDFPVPPQGSTPATINSLTGKVIFQSTRGSLTIRYSTPNQAPCGSKQALFTIIINDAPEADFSFGQPSYCPAIDTVRPTFVGSQGATSIFSELNALQGLVFLDTGNGLLDIASSHPGSYIVKHYVDINGSCKDSTNRVITINPIDNVTQIQAQFQNNNTTYCAGDSIILNVISDTVQDGIWSVFPNSLTPIYQDSSIFIREYTGIDDVQFIVTYAGYGLCEEVARDTFLVIQRDPTLLSYPDHFLGDAEFCNNDRITLPPNVGALVGVFDCIGPQNLLVNTTTGLLDLFEAPQGLYTISFRPQAFCRLDGLDTIQIWDSPDRDLLRLDVFPDTICVGEPVWAETTPIDTVRYYLNGQIVSTCTTEICPFPAVDDGDSLRVEFINRYGCRENFSDTLVVHPYPVLTLTPSDSTVYVESDSVLITMESTAPFTVFDWFTTLKGSELDGPTTGRDSIVFPSEVITRYFRPIIKPGTSVMELAFYVTTNAFGCYAKDDSVRFIIIPSANPPIFIPGAFTPNGDKFNDTWLITWPKEDPKNYIDYSLEVFNRSGGLVKLLPQLTDLWDGDNLPDGVYRYLLRDTEGRVVKHGGVTIKR